MLQERDGGGGGSLEGVTWCRQAGYSGWEKAFIYWDVSKAEFKTRYLLM
jgi:hypothetical protein